MDIIHLSSYTNYDKQQIFKNHLYPKVLKQVSPPLITPDRPHRLQIRNQTRRNRPTNQPIQPRRRRAHPRKIHQTNLREDRLRDRDSLQPIQPVPHNRLQKPLKIHRTTPVLRLNDLPVHADRRGHRPGLHVLRGLPHLHRGEPVLLLQPKVHPTVSPLPLTLDPESSTPARSAT